MKKLWLVILAGLFLSACGANLPAGLTAAPAKPKVGETVAFAMSREGFGEGKVESIDGSRYKIKYGETMVTKEESDVYPVAKAGEKAAVKPGDMVVAKMEDGNYWAGVEVLAVNGDVVEVKEIWRGKTMNLSADKIIIVRPAAVAEFQKLKAENEFSAKAKQHKPRPPADYKPKAGDRVVAEWSGNTWYDGEVLSVAGEKAKIKWQTFKESELGFENIMPYPKPETSGGLPAANSYVLVKPAGGSGNWTYAQVSAIQGSSAEVKSADGKTRLIKADECIALN